MSLNLVPEHVDYDDFFRIEFPRVVVMVHALIGDRAAAEDVAQDVFFSAQQSWAKIAGYDKPGAWVRRVAVHRAANVRRRRGREQVALTRVGIGDPVRDVAALADERLWASVRALPRQQSQAVVLMYVDDAPIAEIAEVLGCSVGSVKTHLSRARAALARELNIGAEEAQS